MPDLPVVVVTAAVVASIVSMFNPDVASATSCGRFDVSDDEVSHVTVYRLPRYPQHNLQYQSVY